MVFNFSLVKGEWSKLSHRWYYPLPIIGEEFGLFQMFRELLVLYSMSTSIACVHSTQPSEVGCYTHSETTFRNRLVCKQQQAECQ